MNFILLWSVLYDEENEAEDPEFATKSEFSINIYTFGVELIL